MSHLYHILLVALPPSNCPRVSTWALCRLLPHSTSDQQSCHSNLLLHIPANLAFSGHSNSHLDWATPCTSTTGPSMRSNSRQPQPCVQPAYNTVPTLHCLQCKSLDSECSLQGPPICFPPTSPLNACHMLSPSLSANNNKPSLILHPCHTASCLNGLTQLYP